MNYRIAEFRTWFPKGTFGNDQKGVLVTVPGSNHDGRDMIHWKELRTFCEKHQLALVGSHFEDIDPKAIEGYADASGGSGQALLDYLEKRNLGKVPIFLWGFSAGGQFNYEMANFAPQRIKAFVVNKGGFYYTALANPLTRKIPALFFTGIYDDYFRQQSIKGIFFMNKRDRECNWHLIQEECGHDPMNSLETSLEFFEGIIETPEVL